MNKLKIFHLNSFKKARILSIYMLFIGFLINSHSAFCQPGIPSLPVVTAPSPKATMMNRYGTYPVSLYTGLVDITIPIFEVNINGLKVPVEFKYHASGLKYDDHPMELGYGWTLIAGGTISRGVRGTPYDRPYSGSATPYFWVKNKDSIQRFLSTASGNQNDQTKLIDINNGVKVPLTDYSVSFADSESDVFNYNFLHHCGQMYYHDGNNYPIKVPANGLDVTAVMSYGNIFDNEGINYFFTKMDQDDFGFNEVWYLTKIISANKADTVIFDYTTFSRVSNNAIHKTVIDQRFEFRNKVLGSSGAAINDWSATGSGKTVKLYYPPRLNSIQYRGGKIEFVYTSATASRNLSEIKIYDNRNILYRIVKLQKPRTDWLDGIEFRDIANAIQETYTFGYNGTPATTYGIDYWGYYNGNPIGSGYIYIPNFTVFYADNGGGNSYTIPGTNRTPNFTYMQGGVLNKITYPTKGYTVFEYEAHKASNQVYGGLRIKEIRNYNHDNTLAEKKWYKYGTGESGNGRAVFPISGTVSSVYLPDFYREFFLLEISNGSVPDKSYFKYFYPFPLTDYFSLGSTVVYPEVAEYSGTGSVSNGKTVYKYTDNADVIQPTFRVGSQPQKHKSWPWKNGLLTSKEVYNSGNQKIYSLTNTYSYLSTSETMNLGVVQYGDITDESYQGNSQYSAEYAKNNLNDLSAYYGQFSTALDGSLFDYSNYYITTGIPVVASSVEYLDGVTTTTTYSGHNNLGLPGQMQLTNSNGDNLITKYKYPTDLSSTAPYNTMVTNNIRTPVIHREQYKGATFLSKSVNEYKNWGSNMFEPEILKLQATAGASLENRITYHNRDSRGNPRYISKDGADHVVYIWGYNQQYPIAEITGATYSEVIAKISESALNTIAAKSEPASGDFITIDNLRTQLPNAQITTYTYKPLVGVLKMTDPRGVETIYNYDNFGRLTGVVRAGRQEEAVNYNYKN